MLPCAGASPACHTFNFPQPLHTSRPSIFYSVNGDLTNMCDAFEFIKICFAGRVKRRPCRFYYEIQNNLFGAAPMIKKKEKEQHPVK